MTYGLRQRHGAQDTRANCVEGVVRQVRDAVGESDAVGFRGGGRRLDPPRVRANAVAHLPRQVRVLEHLEDADALRGMVPLRRREVRRQGVLAGVAERRVADVVAERDRLCQRLVEAERRSQRARHLRHLHGVGQARDVVVALGVEVDLRLVLQPPKRLGMDDPIPVALEGGPELVGLLRTLTTSRCRRPCSQWTEPLLLRLATCAVTAEQLRRSAHLLHGPMMPWAPDPLGRPAFVLGRK